MRAFHNTQYYGKKAIVQSTTNHSVFSRRKPGLAYPDLNTIEAVTENRTNRTKADIQRRALDTEAWRTVAEDC